MGKPLHFLKKKEVSTQIPQKKQLPGLATSILHKELTINTPSTSAPSSLPPPPMRKPPEDQPKAYEPTTGFFSNAQPEIHLGSQEHQYNPEPLPSIRHISAPEELEEGFFSGLAKHLSVEQALMASKQELHERDLLSEMKDYWENQRSSTSILKHSRELETEVLGRVEELRRLEMDWQRLENQIEDCRREMLDKERAIEDQSKVLKHIMRKWTLKKDAPRDQAFRLSSGLHLRNVAELAHHMRKLDQGTFDAHVTPIRNDFANWVRDVFKDEQLALEIEEQRDRDRIIATLDSVLK